MQGADCIHALCTERMTSPAALFVSAFLKFALGLLLVANLTCLFQALLFSMFVSTKYSFSALAYLHTQEIHTLNLRFNMKIDSKFFIRFLRLRLKELPI